jgi:Mce-associated membrane protein
MRTNRTTHTHAVGSRSARAARMTAVPVGAVLALTALTSCGSDGDEAASPGLHASSSCSDFLAAADEDRSRALRQLAADLGAADAVTPMGATQVDYTCAQDPDTTLGDAVAALNGSDPDASAEPSETAGAAGPVADPAAQEAIENGVVAALSYSWDSIDDDMAAAQAVMTPEYWQEAEQTWDVVKGNAATDHTTVEVSVLASGVVTQDAEQGTYLVFLDRPTTNDANSKPVVYKDAVLVTVATDESGTWLIDSLDTAGVGAEPTPTEGPVAVAAEMVAKMSTVTADDLQPDGTMDEYNASMKPLLTAAFYASFLENAEKTLPAMLEQGYESSFDAIGAGVVDADAESATVLVGGTRVTSFDGAENEPETLRMQVELVNVDGTWLVDDFMPVTS